MDTLQAMTHLVEQTGARIVLTARTSFWQSEVEGPFQQFSAGDPRAGLLKRIHKFPIKPFDQNNATLFFDKRLGGDKKIGAAVGLFKELAKDSEEFAGRGFVLSLISDLVSEAGQGLADRRTKKH